MTQIELVEDLIQENPYKTASELRWCAQAKYATQSLTVEQIARAAYTLKKRGTIKVSRRKGPRGGNCYYIPNRKYNCCDQAVGFVLEIKETVPTLKFNSFNYCPWCGQKLILEE